MMSVTWAMLIPMFLAIIVLLLIDNYKRRAAVQQNSRTTLWIIMALVGFPILLLGTLGGGWFVVSHVSTDPPPDIPPTTKTTSTAVSQLSTIPGLPVQQGNPSAETAEKGDDEYSQAVATKTVGMLRAMVRALGRALVEEEKSLAEKKGTAKPAAVAPVVAKPAWVNAVPCLVGDVYRMSISVGPYTSRAECDAQLPEALQKALGQYVEACLGDQTSEEVRLPSEELRQKVVKDVWQETRQYSVGPMIQLYALLEFDRPMKDRVLDAHRQALVDRRLQMVAIWASLGLSALAIMFGYFKTDLATGGTYRNRLRLIALTSHLGVVAVAAAVGYC